MWTKRTAVLPVLALIGPLLTGWAGIAGAASDVKVAGIVDVLPAGSGGTLTLPLAPGAAPVDLLVSLGAPSLQVLVQITPATVITAESGLPVTITDGDRVKAEAMVVGSVLRASKLEVEKFPEIELIGTAKGLPASGVTLPLPVGQTLDFVVSLSVSGADMSVRMTGATRVEHGPLTLVNGAVVQVESVLQNFHVVVTEISVGGLERGEDESHRQ